MEIGTCIASLKSKACGIFGTGLHNLNILPLYSTNLFMKPLVIDAKQQKAGLEQRVLKFRTDDLGKSSTGLPQNQGFQCSVRISSCMLYMLVDDQNKKCLFYGNTLQKSIRKDSSFTTVEAAELVGEELIKTCVDLSINEISSYDCNGFSRGEQMQAFEIALERHGFLPR